MSKLRILVSVADKSGIVDFCQAMTDQADEFIASGGTAAALAAAGLAVTPIDALGALPEMLDGRVKTLQPQIHGGILSLRTPAHEQELAALGIGAIDMVVVNLYPFEETVAQVGTRLADALEQIDIGGVALIRAAAKNHEHVTVIVDPADYDQVVSACHAGSVDPELRRQLAVKAFQRTMAYDAAIAAYLEGQTSADSTDLPARMTLDLTRLEACRYGENPHQRGGFYGVTGESLPFRQVHGKPMSFNNWLDLDGGWRAAHAFTVPTVSIVKHGNPCGIASAADLHQAYADALSSDPVSAFGGIVSCNRTLDAETAALLFQLFVEVVAAPDFAPQALAQLRRKKNIRLLQACPVQASPYRLQSILGGVLVQDQDEGTEDLDTAHWTCVTQRQPSDQELQSLAFAWNVARFVKSNAIVLVQGTGTVGIGAGQMSRLDSVHLAARKAGERARGAVLASDAFFPFPDGIEEAARAGVRAVVQPGGSLRDRKVIQAADELGLSMLFTGTRHFRH